MRTSKHVGPFTLIVVLALSIIVGAVEAAPKLKVDNLLEQIGKVLSKNEDFKFSARKPIEELLPKLPSLPPPREPLLREMRQLTDHPEILKKFEQLSATEQSTILEMGKSMGSILDRYGKNDGGVILKNMDKEGLMFHRTMSNASKSTVEAMYRDSELATNVLRKTGEKGMEFYEKYISPHKGKWIAGGALAAFYSNPEYFIDNAGKLTEYAISKMLELGIKITEKTGKTLWEKFFESPWSMLFFVILGLVFLNWLGGHFGLARGWLFKWPVRGTFLLLRRKVPEELQCQKSSQAPREEQEPLLRS